MPDVVSKKLQTPHSSASQIRWLTITTCRRTQALWEVSSASIRGSNYRPRLPNWSTDTEGAAHPRGTRGTETDRRAEFASILDERIKSGIVPNRGALH